jgi:hypothetical protein
MSRVRRTIGWIGWILLAFVLATAWYLYLVVSNA